MTSNTTPSNKRRTPRKTARARARVTFDRGNTSLRCEIRDISATGAQVEIAGAKAPPAIIHLVDMPRRLAYEASVIWRRPPLYGLAFIETLPLTKPDTPLYLRKLWFECAR